MLTDKQRDRLLDREKVRQTGRLIGEYTDRQTD